MGGGYSGGPIKAKPPAMPPLVRCRGCGDPFTRKQLTAHRPDCIKCRTCGHSVAMKVAGCHCCETA